MRRRDIGFEAISIEGGLISPDKIANIAARAPSRKLAEGYDVPKGLDLRDEITRYFRIGQSLWRDRNERGERSLDGARSFATSMLTEVFGFEDVSPLDGRSSPYLQALDGRVILCAAPASVDGLDPFRQSLSAFGDGPGAGIASRRPGDALQRLLNRSEHALWGIALAGDRFRLMRDSASLTREAYLEADLGAIFRDEMFADFAALWQLMHRTSFGRPGEGRSDSRIERWREEGVQQGTAARDRLRGNVEEALRLLGQGLLDQNEELRHRLDSGELTDQALFVQLLRLVYRLIFIAVAESRGLLLNPRDPKAARELYRGSYGFSHLRKRSLQRASRDSHVDGFEGLKLVMHSLGDGEPALALPALGGLFDPRRTPDLLTARIPNDHFFAAIYNLAFIMRDDARERINWRDMQTEELGSVYESLLELVPQRSHDGRKYGFAGGADARGNARKVSGSYYTPDSLVQALLDSALDPVLDAAERKGGAEAILSLSICDPACGSGHFLLGVARRMAVRVAQLRDPEAPNQQAALREVVRRCIFGVDRNPMAVELAKVALWIEAVEPGKPLGFLDANIRQGDSLLGVFDLSSVELGIPNDAFKALTGDETDAANALRTRNRTGLRELTARREGKQYELIDSFDGLSRDMKRARALSEDTASQIARKRERLESIRAEGSAQSRLKTACDLYVGAFLLKKSEAQKTGIPTTQELVNYLSGHAIPPAMIAAARDASEGAFAFHWALEFPDIMAGGGFDVVLGNPPWEVLQLSEVEFFAGPAPEISGKTGKSRKTAISKLEKLRPELFQHYETTKRRFEAVNQYTRACGRYDLTAKGKINTYSLFSEHFLHCARERAGLIVPTGIATDATTAPFFAHLVSEKRLASLFDFENRSKLFEAVDSRMKFCLLTLGRNESYIDFAFFLTDPDQLVEEARRFTLSPADIAAINPNTKTAPVFRSSADAELTAKIYRHVPILIDESKGEAGNPWGVTFRQGLFNMTSDSGLFRKSRELEAAGYRREGPDWVSETQRPARYVPLYEAKMIHQFDHRWAGYNAEGESTSNATPEQKADPNWQPEPRYWVPKKEVEDRLNAKGWTEDWLMGWRDITNATNERTVIASVFPRMGVSNKLPIIFLDENLKSLSISFISQLSSLVFDFVARQKMGGTTLNYYLIKQFPTLNPSFFSSEKVDFINRNYFQSVSTSDFFQKYFKIDV